MEFRWVTHQARASSQERLQKEDRFQDAWVSYPSRYKDTSCPFQSEANVKS